MLSAQDTSNKADTLTNEKSIEYYNSILKRNKNSAFANFGLASVYFMKKDFDAVIKYCRKNIKNPNDYRADSYILYGLSLEGKARITDATTLFEEAYKTFPENFQIAYQLSLNYYKVRNYDKGLKTVKATIKLKPLYVPAHYLYGCFLFESKNDPGSPSAFLFALLLDNDTIKSKQAIAFLDQSLQHKVESITVPFFEERYKISSIDDILMYYFSEQAKYEIFKKLKEEDLLIRIQDYINNSANLVPEYKDFFQALIRENQVEVFSHYILRSFKNNNYLDTWLKLNRRKLNDFATFLNNNLPEK
jgi:hypothetical protein